MEKYFKDLSLGSKSIFANKFEVLPYPKHVIRKALAESDAIIITRNGNWVLSPKSVDRFFNILLLTPIK